MAVSVIIPFVYDIQKFEQLRTDECKMEEFEKIWKSVKFNDKDWWNQDGKSFILDEQRPIIRRYDRTSSAEANRQLGLVSQGGVYYNMKGIPGVKLFIDKVGIWILNNGYAFADVRIFLQGDKGIDLENTKTYLITKLRKRSECQMIYEKASGEKISVSIKSLTNNIIESLNEVIGAKEQEKRTFEVEYTYSMWYLLTEKENSNKTEVFDILKRTAVDEEIKTENYEHEHYYSYLKAKHRVHCGIFENSVTLLADNENAFARIRDKNKNECHCKGLCRSVFYNFMSIYIYNIAKILELGSSPEDYQSLQRWNILKEYKGGFARQEQGHVNDIFRKHLLCIFKLNHIEKAKIPLRKNVEEQDYIFISYSHKDYAKVYRDLAEFYQKGVNYWYDEGIHPGENWKETAEEKINSSHCVGVLFYASENLFLSKFTNTEMKLTREITDKKNLSGSRTFSYVPVNLVGEKPYTELLRSSFMIKEFNLSMEEIKIITETFYDNLVYIPYNDEDSSEVIMDMIQVKFPSVFLEKESELAFDRLMERA